MTKKNLYAGLIFLILSSLILAACSPQATPAAEPTLDTNMIYTQAAQTVQAGLAQTPVVEPTTAPTDTPAPTATIDPNVALAMTATAQSVQPQPGNGTGATATTAAGTGAQPATTATATLYVLPTATKAVVAPPPKSTGDKAELIGQVPGDGSNIPKYGSFDVALTFKNTGTTTWTKKYRLAFFAGDRMGSPTDVVMTKEVKPGDSITLAFTMKASDKKGSKRTIWVLQNADAMNFYSLWLDTNVID